MTEKLDFRRENDATIIVGSSYREIAPHRRSFSRASLIVPDLRTLQVGLLAGLSKLFAHLQRVVTTDPGLGTSL